MKLIKQLDWSENIVFRRGPRQFLLNASNNCVPKSNIDQSPRKLILKECMGTLRFLTPFLGICRHDPFNVALLPRRDLS
jgi:hypothetical protein